MSSASPEYLKEPLWVKLASMGFAGFHEQAALQDDHLLVVKTRGFVESYRRFKFGDISGILVSRDHRWLYWMLIPLAETLISLFMIFYNHAASLWMPLEVFYLWIALAFFKLVLNLAAGPTCTVIVQSAVQQYPLESLHRWNRLNEKMEPLIERILQAQGPVSDAQKALLNQQVIAKHIHAETLDKGNVHLAVGFCQLVGSLAILLYGMTQSSFSFALLFLGIASAAPTSLIAIRKQNDQPLFGLLAGAAWFGLVWCFMAISVFFTSVIYVSLIDDVLTTDFSIQPYVHYFLVDLRGYPTVFYSYLLVLILGAVGFLLTLLGYAEYRRRYLRGAHE